MTPTTGQRLVAIYARVSTTEQVDTGYSLPTQIESCQACTAREEYTVPASYVFVDDSTGTSLQRPQFTKLGFPQPAVPRPSYRKTPESSASRLLSRLSRPRLAVLRFAAGRGGRPPLGVWDAANAVSKRRPPAEAGSREGGAKMPLVFPI